MSEISGTRYRAGSGEPLLLLHGFTGTWQLWRPILADLAARFEVLAPTLPGHDGGPTVTLDGPFTFDVLARWAEQELDRIGAQKAHVVGNSMGAPSRWIGQAWPRAQRRGHRAGIRLASR
jgi:pimeloyl-ACP methyl ester carboxylesterase